MSSRWFARSMFFERSSSFNDSTSFGPDLNKCLKNLEIRDSFSILCWFEKIILIIDYLQLFCILWVAAQPWPWPYLFTITTRPILYVNLDFFSLTKDGALAGKSASIGFPKWGMMDNYLTYAFSFALVQCAVFMSIFLLRRQHKSVYGKKVVRHVDEWIAVALMLSHLIYLPCALAVFRLFYCDKNHNLSAEPTVSCSDIDYIGFTAVSTVLMAIPLIGVPLLTYQYITASSIYRDDTDHEKRLQIWELQYMLGLDSYWLQGQVWLFSSFKRNAAYFRVHMLLFKLLLLFFFIFVRSSLLLQSILFCVFSAIFGLYFTVWEYPFRALSSNLVLLPVLCMIVVNSTFGMVNCFGVESAVMVASTETLVLGVFNVSCLLIIAIVFLYYALAVEVLDWPAVKTMYRITHNTSLIPKAARWVETLRESRVVKEAFVRAPLEVADINALEESMRQLRMCWLSARSLGSIFETALGEALEDLLLTHSRCLPFALRRFPHWNAAYEDGMRRKVFSHRRTLYQMMAPKKRRILLKLLAFRFMKGDRCHFDMNIAMAYKLQQAQLQALFDKKLARKALREAKQKNSKSHFKSFSENAKGFLLLGSTASSKKRSGASSKTTSPGLDPDGAMLDEAGMVAALNAAAAALLLEEQNDEDFEHKQNDDVGVELTGIDRFDPNDVEEAAKMIRHLHTRTELALSKHHHAKKNLTMQHILSQPATTNVLHKVNSGGPSSGASILNKISTMDLIKETVDADEQTDLEELYLLWDEAIQLYELEEFPGDYEQLNAQAENWYTYRGLVSERLEIVVNTLEQNKFDNEIDGQEVIEEGEDDDEEEKGGDEEDQRVPLLRSVSGMSKALSFREMRGALNGSGKG